MTMVKMRGIKAYRHPKTYVEYIYHRKSGIRILAKPGTAAFLEEVGAAEASLKAPAEPKAGSLGLLVKAYRASTFFTDLKRRTRSDYDKVINYLADLDEMPLIEIDRAFVAALRDKVASQRGRRFTNYVLSVVSLVCEFGIDRGDMRSNPAKGVKRVRRDRNRRAMNRPWSAAERDVVMARAPAQLALPIAIARWTGLREGDVLTMPRTVYDGRTITRLTDKREVLAVVPVAEPLKRAIDTYMAAWPAKKPATLTLCANSRFRPWTGSGFRASLFKFLKTLEEEGVVGSGLTFHGLRHTVATELAELGYDDRTIADMLAQESEESPAHYSRKARLEKKLRGVVQKMVRADNRRTKVSTNGG